MLKACYKSRAEIKFLKEERKYVEQSPGEEGIAKVNSPTIPNWVAPKRNRSLLALAKLSPLPLPGKRFPPPPALRGGGAKGSRKSGRFRQGKLLAAASPDLTGAVSAGSALPAPLSASVSRPTAAVPLPFSRASPSLCSGTGVREAKTLFLPTPHHVRSDQRADGAGVGHQEQSRTVGHHLLPLDARYQGRAHRSSGSARALGVGPGRVSLSQYPGSTTSPRPHHLGSLALGPSALLFASTRAWSQQPRFRHSGHPRSVPVAPFGLGTSAPAPLAPSLFPCARA